MDTFSFGSRKRKAFFADNIDDNKLIQLVQNGDEHAFKFLKARYENLLQKPARSFSCTGMDYDDLYQEASISFLDAINSYSDKKHASFEYYAKVCIKRKMLSIYKSASRQKNKLFKDFLPIEKVSEILSDGIDPQDVVARKEYMRTISKRMNNNLTNLEEACFSLFVNGNSYREVADAMGMSFKAVANALQRARDKLRGIVH